LRRDQRAAGRLLPHQRQGSERRASGRVADSVGQVGERRGAADLGDHPAMKYLCLIYEDRVAGKTLPKADIEKAMKEYWAFEDSIKQSGHYLGSNALEDTETATTVRARHADPPPRRLRSRRGGAAGCVRRGGRAVVAGRRARQPAGLVGVGGALQGDRRGAAARAI